MAGFGLGNTTGGCFLADPNCTDPREQACWARRGALLNYHTYHGNPCHGAWRAAPARASCLCCALFRL